jgi:S1-C subfamily serine protease
VKDVITQLEHGKNVDATTPFLGVSSVAVSDLDQQTRQQFNVTVDSGVLIESVVAGSGADKGGLKEGDVVVKADGKDVKSPDDLRSAIQAKKPGDKLSLDIKRGDQSQTIDVTLGSKGAQNS